jgi:multidrug efflux system outer membrane protein
MGMSLNKKPCLLLPFLCVLQGCLVEEPAWKPDNLGNIPAKWGNSSVEEYAGVQDGWIFEFHDPELVILIEEAIQNNPSLKAIESRLEASRQGTLLSSATRIPSISANSTASESRSKSRQVNGSWEPWTTSSNSGIGLSASWELDVWKRIGNEYRAVVADYEAEREDYHAAKLSIAANTARAWFNLIAARQQMDLAEKTRDSFQRNYRITERKYKAGDPTATALSVNFGRNQIASAERQYLDRKLARDEARRNLELILGRYPAAKLEDRDTLPKLEKSVPPGLPCELLNRRPDLVASSKRIKASAARAASERKSLLPSIRLSAGGSQSLSSLELKELIKDPSSIARNMAISVSQPLFGRSAMKASARQALARNQAAVQSYRSTALKAFRDVESALNQEESLLVQEPFLETELHQAILAENQATRDYSQGIIEILSVLEAQRRAFNARSRMISFQNELLQNRISLYLALGGDFTME